MIVYVQALITSKCTKKKGACPEKQITSTLPGGTLSLLGTGKGMRSEGLLVERVPLSNGISPENQKVPKGWRAADELAQKPSCCSPGRAITEGDFAEGKDTEHLQLAQIKSNYSRSCPLLLGLPPPHTQGITQR